MLRKVKAFPKRHPLILSLLLGIIGNLIWTVIQTGLNKVNFFEAFWQVPKIICDFVIKVLTLDVPVWGVLLVAVVIILSFWTYIEIADKPQKDEPHKEYTADSYKGQKYKWEWWGNTLAELRPICNECDGELAPDDRYGYHLICPNCDKQYQKPDVTTQNLASTYFVNKVNTKLKNLKK